MEKTEQFKLGKDRAIKLYDELSQLRDTSAMLEVLDRIIRIETVESHTNVNVMSADRIDKMRDLVKTQCQDGNWNCNQYMFGMANGMILMMAMIDGVAPKYLSAPKQFLDDLPQCPSCPSVAENVSGTNSSKE